MKQHRAISEEGKTGKEGMSKPEYVELGCNIPLETPRHTKRKTIYQAVNKLSSKGGSDFIPMWDSTDHFNFCCAKCGCAADVLEVDFYPNYSGDAKGTKMYALFIFLGCPKCGATGFRKIYLKPKSFHGQIAFTEKARLAFGAEREAIETVPAT